MIPERPIEHTYTYICQVSDISNAIIRVVYLDIIGTQRDVCVPSNCALKKQKRIASAG